MPDGIGNVPFFVMLSGGAMGLGCKFMLLGGSQVRLVRGFLVWVGHKVPFWKRIHTPFFVFSELS